MMLMQMRLQKNQIPSLYEYKAAGSYAFASRDLAIMAGYTNYDVLIVGASGGFSGNHAYSAGFLAHGVALTAYGSGPGGGASLRLQGKISELAVSTPILVGAAGSDSANKTDGLAPYTSGGDGGYSQWQSTSYVAGGGFGAQMAGRLGNASGEWVTQTRGGEGGTNTANLGVKGVVGIGAWRKWNLSGTTIDDDPGTPPTDSTYVAGGTYPIVGGGCGGPGGAGRYTYAVSGGAASAGGKGSNTALVDNGGAVASDKGGAGGGVDLYPVTGVHEYYGTKTAGKNSQGAVVVKLS